VTGSDPAGSLVLTRLPGRATAPDAAQVMRLFPPRPTASGWPATRQPREQVLTRLLAPPFTLDNPAGLALRAGHRPGHGDLWCGRAVACARMMFGWRIARLTVQAAAAPEAWHEPVLWV
jgi:hypothetical protein